MTPLSPRPALASNAVSFPRSNPLHLLTLSVLIAASAGAAELSSPVSWGRPGVGPGELDTPLGLASRDGFVYVADHYNQRVQKFTTQGAFVLSFGAAGSEPGHLVGPGAISTDGRGHVFVADLYAHAVQKFTTEGVFVSGWGTFGSGPGQFRGPAGIAVGANGDVFVTDLDNQRVQRFTGDGVFVGAWGGPGEDPGQLSDPWGIAVDSHGDVYVADHGNHRIQKFTPEGRVLGTWGSMYSVDCYLFGPVGVAVGRGDAVYVTDLVNHQVQKFGSDGGFVTQWSEETLARSEGPQYSVAVDGDRVYVADASRHMLRSFRDVFPDRFPRHTTPVELALGPVWPNPTRGTVTVAFGLPAEARVRADVFDLHGRLVRGLFNGLHEAGVHRLSWDGRTDDGRPASAGLYFVRATVQGAGFGRTLDARVAMVR